MTHIYIIMATLFLFYHAYVFVAFWGEKMSGNIETWEAVLCISMYSGLPTILVASTIW